MGDHKKRLNVSRAERKVKKRKLEDAIPDVPEDDTIGDPPKKIKLDENAPHTAHPQPAISSKSEISGTTNSRNSSGQPSSEHPTDASLIAGASDVPIEGQIGARKSKKERKAERKAKEAAEAAKEFSREAIAEVQPDASTSDLLDKNTPRDTKRKKNPAEKRQINHGARVDGSSSGKDKNKTPRFIVFIGNLPFSATLDSIKEHFKAVKPTGVRHLTRKDDPTKSRGCAFIEFDGYDHMKTCLKLYHHSLFDDGISPPRKINVELTAGGGGNTKDRKAKIKGKNEKLNEERIRRIQEEKTSMAKEGTSVQENGIHPSRRGMVPSS